MRLLYVAPSLDPALGGVVEAIRSMGSAQAALGHHVEAVSVDAPDAKFVRNFSIPADGLGPAQSFYGYRADLVERLREKARGFDAVIANGLWQYPSVATRKACAGVVPYFIFPHGMLDPYFRSANPVKHLKKTLYWWLAERQVLRDARAVLFTCEEERRLASKSFWPFQCREETVGLGCPAPALARDRQVAECHAKWPFLAERKVILFFGRLHEKKGCDLLLEGFGRWQKQSGATAAEWQLVMAGPPASEGYSRELQSLAARHCAPGSVSFVGMVTGGLKWGLLQLADAFILPSHQENFGLAVAEALACGTPVLISNKVNIWREIAGDGAGLVTNDDTAGVLKLLGEWTGLPKEARANMRTAAARCFTDRFEAHHAAAEMVRVLERCGVGASADRP